MSLSAKLAYPFNSGKWLRDKGIMCKGWKEKLVEWFLGASLLVGWGLIFYFAWCGVIGFFIYDEENIVSVAAVLTIPSFLWLFMQQSNYYDLYAEKIKMTPRYMASEELTKSLCIRIKSHGADGLLEQEYDLLKHKITKEEAKDTELMSDRERLSLPSLPC